METHAHHLHKAPGQKLWHYFFEFLMLFLAVFCGFLAEYKLEHRIEKDREEEFIASAVKEIRSDIREIEVFESDSNRYKYLDTISMLLLGSDRSQPTMKKLYFYFMRYSETGGYVLFKRSTLTQLKSAGNMRLIRKSPVVDSLIGWDGSVSHSFDVLDNFNRITYDNIRLACKVFDGRFYIRNKQWGLTENHSGYEPKIRFLTGDEKLIRELGLDFKHQSLVLRYYNECISSHKQYTQRLADFFIKEYELHEL